MRISNDQYELGQIVIQPLLKENNLGSVWSYFINDGLVQFDSSAFF